MAMRDQNTDRSRDSYTYFVTLQTRWMDNDIYGHVNNAHYYSYFDSAANKYLIEQAGLDIQNSDVVGLVVNSECNYHAPVAYPQTLEIGFRANKIGNSSVQYGLAVFVKGEDEASAHGTFTHVFVNQASGKSVPIPEKIRSALQRVHAQQSADPNLLN